MIFSVSGDIHGRIDYLYASVSRWQQINKQYVDLILQVGDFGFFKNIPSTDSTSLKKSRFNDGEKLVSQLLSGEKDWSAFKSSIANPSNPFSKIEAPIIFVDGNHDDHALLNDYILQSDGGPLVPINDHLLYLKRGAIATVENDSESLVIGGLGGIDKCNRPKKYLRNNLIAFTDEDLYSFIDTP